MPHPMILAPGAACDLDAIPSRINSDEFDKQSAYERIAQNAEEMAKITPRLYAENRHSILLVLQGMDAAGKDSTIRTVTRGMNPRSLVVHSFKKPGIEELDHDFLWRIHYRAPRKGNIVIFNRSHYEDVLIVRVHDLIPGLDWQQRYRQINDFERLLVETGTTMIKCYLHISRDEQRKRLQARIDNPDAHWKFNTEDLEERKRWDDYRLAYNEAITNCNTAHAPWYIVPADRKWYRKLVVSELLLNALREINPVLPDSDIDYRGLVVD